MLGDVNSRVADLQISEIREKEKIDGVVNDVVMKKAYVNSVNSERAAFIYVDADALLFCHIWDRCSRFLPAPFIRTTCNTR